MTIYCPKIYGKKQYDLASNSKKQVFAAIKKFYHLSKDQFYAIGGEVWKVVHPEKIAQFNSKNSLCNK